jgi:16S rRNA (guanine966-N2)-methyltransferase
VVAGEAKGRRLRAPAGRATRPTSDRVREAVFDVLGSLDAVEGAEVVDLFAGSGALGLEALSRGARRATFVERDRAAIVAIEANLATCGIGAERADVIRADALVWVTAAPMADLVLADPPYAFAGWADLLAGLAVFEAAAPLDVGPGWRILREKQYGGTVVTFAQPSTRRDGPASRNDRKGGT